MGSTLDALCGAKKKKGPDLRRPASDDTTENPTVQHSRSRMQRYAPDRRTASGMPALLPALGQRAPAEAPQRREEPPEDGEGSHCKSGHGMGENAANSMTSV